MSSLSALDRDLCGILTEMRSEKITQRSKAFEKLDSILHNREEDIIRYMTEQKFDTNWQDVLEAAHHGIHKQNRKLLETNSTGAGGVVVDSKCYIYIKVIQQVIDLAMNRGEPQIKFSELIRRIMDVLGDSGMLQYFGTCYVQILQKHVLNSKRDLTVITYDEWIAILTRCSELYDDARVTKLNVVNCLALAIRKSLANCSVQSHFATFLDPLKKMIVESDRGRMQNELIKIAYCCIEAIAVDYRYEVCNFTEKIIPCVVKAYEPKMDEDTKAIFFRLMHLTVIVHHPEKSFSEWRSNQDLFFTNDETEWYKCLRVMHFVVCSEIKAHVSASYNVAGRKEISFTEDFVNFAARLSYVIFWHDEVWNQSGSDDGGNPKKIKRANKLQSLMDLIEADSSQPDWRWLILLAEIVDRCPVVLEEDDYQPLLHMLSRIQPKLQFPSQLKAFRLCCKALVNFEKEDIFKASTIISSTYCNELWHKITECSFRCSTSNNKSAADNHLILQLLITSRKYPSVAFLNSVLQAFYAYSIDRTNINVTTIRTILETVPLEVFGAIQETVEKLFNYMFPKSRETQAKGILHNKERLDVELVASISVNCTVTKHAQSSMGSITTPAKNAETRRKYLEPDEHIRMVEENILLKRIEKLLLLENATSQSDLTGNMHHVTYNIHEKNFELLCTAINFEKNSLPAESDAVFEGLINIIYDIELYLKILNDLLLHSAMNKDAFEKCSLTKKITFKIQEIELGFGRLKGLTAVELNELSSHLLSIFRGPYHSHIKQQLKTSNFTSMFDWIFKNAKSRPERDSRNIEALRYENLNKEQLNQYNLLLIIAHYLDYDGVNTDAVKTFLDKVLINIDSNLDLFYLFNIIKVLIKQTSTFFVAEWVLAYIKDVCRNHHTNIAMTEAIIDLFDDLVVFVSPHDALFNDTNTVLLSFISKANKKVYSVQLQRKIYDQVKFLSKAYPEYYASHETIYRRMITLLGSPSFVIKISGVVNLLHLFSDEWVFSKNRGTIDFYRFQQKLYAEIVFGTDDLLLKDEKEGLHAAYLQLICGVFANSYHLKRRALMDLIEQVYLHEYSQNKVKILLNLIRMTTGIDPIATVQDSMEQILDRWISKKYKITNIPWYFTTSESLKEFIKTYRNVIAFTVLCHIPLELSQFCSFIKQTMADTLKAISAHCTSFLIPKWANCTNLPIQYSKLAEEMEQVISSAHVDIKQCISSDESKVLIVQKLISYLHDEKSMRKLFAREILIPEAKCSLNMEGFLKCLDYFKTMFSTTSKQQPLTYLCTKHPTAVEQILLCFKKNINRSEIVEEKLIILYQYSALVDQMDDYFGQHRSANLKEYLVRDITYFLCHTMITIKSLQVSILNVLENFLKYIIPTCAEYLRPYLNFLVSSLLFVHDQRTSQSVSSKVIDLLKLIVIEHHVLFGDGVKKLNYFPETDEFGELRRALGKLKETQYQLTLAEDINRIIQLPSLKYEELATLRSMLADNKNSLCELCDELESSDGLSETCSRNVLIRLINVLLDEVRHSSSDRHTIEALRCLGEIGPIDLSTLVLRSDTDTEIYQNWVSLNDTTSQLVQVLIVELNKLVVTRDLQVVEKASAVSYHVLQNGAYRKLAADTRTLFPYMALAETDCQIFERTDGRIALCALIDSGIDCYTSFVLALSTTLLEFVKDTVIKTLTDIETIFAAKIIPLLMRVIMSFCDDKLNKDIEDFVNSFFEKFNNSSTPVSCISKNVEAIHLMLKIVECIRLNNQNEPQPKIRLKYLAIATASLHCQAYFKAIMYAELWCLNQHNEGASSDTYKRDSQLMAIMKTAHLSIGIDEATKAFLDPISARNEYYQLERKYNQNLLYYDVVCASGNTVDRLAYTEALKRSCLYELASKITTETEVDYECAWRLADWNMPLDDVLDRSKSEVDWQHTLSKQHYKALKSLELKDEVATESAVFEGRRAIGEMLKIASMESTKNIYPYLCKLRQLQQIEDFMSIQFLRNIDGHQELLQKWDLQDKLPYSDFSFMENILTQRIVMLKTARIRALRKWVPDALNQARFQLIHEARITGNYNVATANICAMGQQTMSEDVRSLVMLEDAQLNWAIGDKFLSRRLVNEIVAGGKCKDLMVNAAAYRFYGIFLAETHAEDVHNIYKNFFKQSQALVEESLRQASQQEQRPQIDYQGKCLHSDRNFIVLHSVAKYADREFMRLKTHFSSNEYKLKKQNLEMLKKELSMIEAEQAKTKESEKEKLINLRRAKMSMRMNAARDEESVKTMKSNMNDYLQLALLYYSSFSRKMSVESDLSVFRIVALWLGNHSSIADSIRDYLNCIPTHKLVPVLPQLTPRLDNRSDGVGKIVSDVLERCAIDHPYHTLPHIFAQVYAFADVDRTEIPKDDERLLGAQALYHKLLKKQNIAIIVDQYTDMNLALIEMANKSLGSAKGFSDYTLTSRDALKKCKDLDKVHCPTVELRIRENCVYDDIVGIHFWDDQIQGVGGINAPKKLICHCMDGQDRIQLLKGKDDMRQDAVMEQVFTILNVLMRHDKEAHKRKLTVRTYKVVPLSRQSGILEWCSDTIPLGAWLIAAHTRYRPKDISPLDARKSFAELAKSSLRTKQEKFLKICQRLSPVFQHFFLERFLMPGMWFERRLCYTRSVAVSSMVGYILGIGDRHVQNILVDEKTAEVIHIDFGIAFELGKNLPTPETIPFRLTRDIVAGMGVSGIEGIFKKSCEKTMEILRNNNAPILTILEVLLYDPLYTWNVLSNKKAARRQMADMYGEDDINKPDGSSTAVNISAERALLRINDKLNGREDEKFTSVEGQVERLIFAASSNLNLCQLFQGWQPYL
ncbi:serine/threonine-protein kinase ATM [Topomyia yanbarensis]|uniref:serine/threonine-protein kinase ATM n=1 Tax=Topomyia yanbarensis TaxID=2498891 RepID=UPI00273BDEC2|nr:serine/threonine-protein kinase ATM [Topomyia yanbarensis]